MIKTLFRDMWWVLLDITNFSQSKIIAEVYGMAEEEFKIKSDWDALFMQYEMGRILTKDLSEKLAKNLWKPELNYFELVDKNIWKCCSINEKIYDFIVSLKWKYNQINLSDISVAVKNALFKNGLYYIFDDLVLSCDTGFSKRNDLENQTTHFFDFALNKYWFKAEECLFIDDKQENLDIAKKTGMNTILFENEEKTISTVKKFLDI